ncbi:MAG: tetratricopeptide repeat protein [Ardenticatenaceae bacterium]|nr:tetratricopeptide repeat protein [Ardenticatenaceae bacterium]
MMTNQLELKDVLGRFVQRLHYSAGQVAALSGVPKRTVVNWLSGRVRHPHHWQRLVQVAAALRLNETETTELLQAAAQPSIAALRQQAATEAEQQLLSHWLPATAAPFQVIADLPYFVGREELLKELGELLRNGRSVTIHSLRGMGGVGKTSLAAHLAYQLRHTFTDGVLWARLDTSDTMAILTQFAAAYGQDVSKHHDIESRSAAVRHILADKHVLLILDNAQTSGQVRPLLPPTTGKTAVIVTTREDLAVSDEMHRHLLQSFPSNSGQSLAVFAHFLGQHTVRRWHSTLQEIAHLLGHLPLAIAIAAGRLANQTSVPAYLAELETADNRLNTLIREDRSVRLSFNLSYQALAPDMQKFFVALGAFGGDDFSLAAAAYLVEQSEAQTADYLDTLIHLSLLQPTQPGRYNLHPLLRDFALEKQTNSHSLQRMAYYFIHFADISTNPIPVIANEMSNLTSALDAAHAFHLSELFFTGVRNLYPTWRVQGAFKTAVPYFAKALQAARQNHNEYQLATILGDYGSCYWQMGESTTAKQLQEEGLEIAYRIKNKALICMLLTRLGTIAGYNDGNYELANAYLVEASQLVNSLEDTAQGIKVYVGLGNVAYEQGNWVQAEQYYRQGSTFIQRTQNEEHFDAVLLYQNLGTLATVRGDFAQAKAHLHTALTVSQKLGFAETESTTLARLGQIAHEEGAFEDAYKYLTQALTLARQIQHPEAMCHALCNLGEWATATKAPAAARYLAEAHQITQAAHIPWLESVVLIQTGEFKLSQGKYQSARKHFATALKLATTMNLLEPQAYAYFGLAQVAKTKNEAVIYAEKGLTLFEQMDHVKATAVRNWLSNIKEG